MKTVQRIETLDDIAEGLDALGRVDPRLAAVIAAAGEVPLRRVTPGFASMAAIIAAQQVSRASADAMMARLAALVDPLEASGVLAAGEPVLRAAGLSRAKQRAMIALAAAVEGGRIDLAHLATAGAEEATARLTALPGIGPWTAQIYLLICAGYPDIFPARDVALQGAVGAAFGIAPRPGAAALDEIAASWTPWRSVAARLFWAYWRHLRGRDAAPAPFAPPQAEKPG